MLQYDCAKKEKDGINREETGRNEKKTIGKKSGKMFQQADRAADFCISWRHVFIDFFCNSYVWNYSGI